MRTITILLLLAASAARGDVPVEIGTCDLIDPEGMAGRIVAVRGRMYFNSSGGFLTTGSCPRPVPVPVLLFPHTSDAPSVNFDAEPDTELRLAPFARPNGGSSFACGVVIGELFYKKHFHLHKKGAGPQGDGYGPRGAFRVAIVIKAIPSIGTCD